MKKNRFFVFALLTAASAASAQTSYVASTGTGTTCSKTAPCRTFAAALTALPISGGTILALDSADYSAGSNLFVGSPVIIDGGEHGAFFTGGFQLEPGGGGYVTIRHLTFNDGGVGGVLNGAHVTLEHVTIHSINGSGIALVCTPGVSIDLKHVSILGANTGIALTPVSNNPVGAYSVALTDVTVRANNIGVQIVEGSATIRDSVVGYTNGPGILLTGPVTNPVSVIEHTELVNNTVGLLEGYGTARLSNSLIAGNQTGILMGPGTVISFRNNAFAGNGTDGSPVLSTSLK
jgi:hypothetical protein